MASRREVLKITLAATTWPLAASALGTSVTGDDELIAPYKVLYDVRFAAAHAFARRIAERGLPLQAFAGDVTRFWYHELHHRWQEAPVSIAGLTGYGALFCLEQLAAAQRLRVVFRSEHVERTAGGVSHALEGPAALVDDAARSLARPDWSAQVADVLLKCPRRAGTQGKALVESGARGAARAGEPLYAWMIAPMVKG